MYAIVWSKTRRVGVVAAGMEGKRTAGSAHQADQSMSDQTSRNIMAPNHHCSVLATVLHFSNLAL